MNSIQQASFNGSEIAIIGMSCRFPGAPDLDAFWHNLRNGVESISWFDSQELINSGLDATIVNHPDYVKANSILTDIECFDTFFFNLNAKEAEMMDPQHRLFLEQAWDVMENAGYDSEGYSGAIGVYAGCGDNTYLQNNLYPASEVSDSTGIFQLALSGSKDFLPTRVSYHLDLKGPSINVQTACSTSLVATHLACQSLLNGECDMALAGGVTVRVPQLTGYLYQEGLVLSPDGHCRAFDADAKGTVGGSGVGVVLLKRLEDALADGDNIHAVIKGSAVNNDGSLKVGFTAPGVDGQASVIQEAQAIAQTASETITYVETHGSGTPLGDQIEIAALAQAFAQDSQESQSCAIGSVKTNVGHLDAAAGVAGLLKTVLSLQHKLIPPSLHFKQPNPEIDFANSNFEVNTQLSEWKTNGTPRRAGVSAFGLGGTNAHMVLEEAPPVETSGPSRSWQLVLLSAKTNTALEMMTTNFTDFLQQQPDLNLADATYTLQRGRRCFDYRRMVLCRDVEDAISAFQDPQRVYTSTSNSSQADEATVAFMFTGLGSQYINMGWDLYQSEAVFREQIDHCCDYLTPLLKLDLRDVIYPNRHQAVETSKDSELVDVSSSQSGINLRQMLGREEEKPDQATKTLNQTYITQPAVFVVEYALATLWQSWGINPTAMIGYSLGEYVAACLSGVLALEDALTLVAKRAQLIQTLPNGAMLAVPLPEQEIHPLLNEKISLSAVNGASACVVAGDENFIETLAEQLVTQGIACRRLATSHAFHSYMMESIVPSFIELFKTIQLQTPQIPYVSNLTGSWITPEQATDPQYWVQHLCQPVRFADGVTALQQQQHSVLLEVGPGQTLSSLALQCLGTQKEQSIDILSSLRHAYDQQSDTAFLLNNLGQLWLSGIEIDWVSFYSGEHRHRLPLPTYPFERQRYWIEPQSPSSPQSLLSSSERWALLVQAGQIQASNGLTVVDEPAYVANRQALEQLCIAYINMAFRQLGAFPDSDSRCTLAELAEQSQTIPRYHQLLGRWLSVLVESGQLEQKDNYFAHLARCSKMTVENHLTNVKTKWANNLNFVELIQNCGENLAAVLTGKKEPWDIFSKLVNEIQDEYNLELAEDCYYKPIIRSVVEQLLKTLTPQTKLKVLEVGGGAGITTAELLPLLPPKQTSYTFTDVGRLFLTQAQEKFKDYAFVEYDFLDIEKSSKEQDFPLHHFDLVIASNVLHVVRNIEAALENIRSLLAPGGIVVIWELTQPHLNFDIADALLMNPIDENDSGRDMGNPFLSKEQWQAALNRHGFIEVEAFSETEVFGQHVLVAQADSLSSFNAPDAFTKTSTATVQKAFNPLSRKPDMADWFYVPAWTRASLLQPAIAAKSTIEPECWLVFADDHGLGDQLGQSLKEAGHTIVTVKVGDRFNCPQATAIEADKHHYTYRLSPTQLEDYSSLFQALQQANLTPTNVLHLWSINSSKQPLTLAIEEFQTMQHLGLYSLMCLAQVMDKQTNQTHPLHITAIANQIQLVNGDEKLHPEQATLLAAIKVIPQEYENISCRILDIDLPDNNQSVASERISQLFKEITTSSKEAIVAYRGHHRWLPIFKETPLKSIEDGQTRFKHHGVYLITGGFGYIGSLIAEHLARTVQAKLILTGRSDLPVREAWAEWLATHDNEPDIISRKIRKIQSLEALGSEVLAIPADVADLQQMQGALDQAEQIFGPINGVIHAAGLNTSEGDLTLIAAGVNQDQFEQNFRPKVYGSWVLNQVLQDKELDFCLLISSLSSVLGGKGTIDYTAAMFFVDAFTHWHNQQSAIPWITTNWGFWKVGEAEASRQFLAQNWGELGLMPQEGIEALERILIWENLNQVLISPGHLKEMVCQWGRSDSIKDDIAQPVNTLVQYARPNLKNAYIAPSTELEHKLADIFQSILGFAPIGIHDNFFYLGGDSLVGIKLIAQVSDVFQVDLSLRLLFEAPSIAELALLIEEIIIKEIKSLTEEEVTSAL